MAFFHNRQREEGCSQPDYLPWEGLLTTRLLRIVLRHKAQATPLAFVEHFLGNILEL